MLSNQDFQDFLKEGSKKKTKKQEKKKLDQELDGYIAVKIQEYPKIQYNETPMMYKGLDPELKKKLLEEAR